MKGQELRERFSDLSAHIVQFCRYLRSKGYQAGIAEEVEILTALSSVVLREAEVFRAVLKAVLVKNQRQFYKFDLLFSEYWKDYLSGVDARIKEIAQPNERAIAKPRPKAPSLLALKNWLNGKQNRESTETATFSPLSIENQPDFSSWPSEEISQLQALLREILLRLNLKPGRRYQKSKKNKWPDFKNTLRQSLRKGGEVDLIKYRELKPRKTQLVLICDVSRSMELYSFFLLSLMYGFQQEQLKIESFVFSTQLYRVTAELKNENLREALDAMEAKIKDWHSGTKIGYCLYSFLDNYGGKLLNKNTVVMILSDGWDTGDISLLQTAMQKIHRKASSVIWLNPLAGHPDYSPQVRGMQAALPYIDLFAPVHNLEGLSLLAEMLSEKY